MKLLKYLGRSHKDLRGDTLVEVLISMAILALVLGAAFATSTRSLRVGTDAGIRSQALSYAQQQIEILKTVALNDPDKINSDYRIGRPFCINPNTTAVVEVDSTTNDCPVPVAGASPSDELPYRVVVNYYPEDLANLSNPQQTFVVTVTWPSTSGETETNKVTLHYKPQDSFVTTPGGTICATCDEADPTAPNAPYVSLTASPTRVLQGGLVTLRWETRFVDNCRAEPNISLSGGSNWTGNKSPVSNTMTLGVGEQPNTGRIDNDTTFRIECSRTGVAVPAEDTVTVGVVRITRFDAVQPNPIAYNSSPTLRWESSHTDSCQIDGIASGLPSNGSRSVSPLTADRDFILRCTSGGLIVTANYRVTVNTPPAPVVDVWTSPTSIGHGGSSNIYWRVTNGGVSGTSCNAYGSWSGARTPGNGEQLGPANTGGLSGPNTYTYGISCTNPGGSHSDGATVSVAGPPPPPPDCGDHNHNLSYSISGSFVSWSSSIGGNNPCGVGVSQCNVFNSGGGSLGQVGASGSGNFSGGPAYMRCMDVQGHWFG